jgi:hypothetical protein
MIATAADYAWLGDGCEALSAAYCLTLVKGLTPEEVVRRLGGTTRTSLTGIDEVADLHLRVIMGEPVDVGDDEDDDDCSPSRDVDDFLARAGVADARTGLRPHSVPVLRLPDGGLGACRGSRHDRRRQGRNLDHARLPGRRRGRRHGRGRG